MPTTGCCRRDTISPTDQKMCSEQIAGKTQHGLRLAQIMLEMRAKQIIVNQVNTLPKRIQRYQPLGGP